MYPPHPDLIQLINVKAVQKLILWPRLDHAVNKVYKLSALMTYMYCLSCYSCTIDVLIELCMMLPTGVHNVCLQTSTGLAINVIKWCIPTDNHVHVAGLSTVLLQERGGGSGTPPPSPSQGWIQEWA